MANTAGAPPSATPEERVWERLVAEMPVVCPCVGMDPFVASRRRRRRRRRWGHTLRHRRNGADNGLTCATSGIVVNETIDIPRRP